MKRFWTICTLLIVSLVATACGASTSTVDVAEDATTTTSEPDSSSESESATTEAETVEEAPAEEPADEPDATDPEPTATAEPEPELEPEPTEAPAPDPENLAPGEASVVVLDPGAEPRTELRLVIAPSCGETLSMTQIQELEQTIDGATQPSAGEFGTVAEMAVSVTPRGDNYEVRSEILSMSAAPGTPPFMATQLNQELGALVGLATTVTMNNRGVQLPGTSLVEGAEGLGGLEQMLESLNQVQSPLPVEAVGVGARWETISVLELEGLEVQTTSMFELLSIDGTVVELAVSAEQFVPDGSEMMVPGGAAAVTNWDVVSSGTTTLDLATISPLSSNVTVASEQSFIASFAGQEATLDQSIDSTINLEGAPDDGCTGRTIRP